jgi:hypothetical protein
MTFLPHPAAIRRAIHDLFSAKRIDIAVAFIRAVPSSCYEDGCDRPYDCIRGTIDV